MICYEWNGYEWVYTGWVDLTTGEQWAPSPTPLPPTATPTPDPEELKADLSLYGYDNFVYCGGWTEEELVTDDGFTYYYKDKTVVNNGDTFILKYNDPSTWIQKRPHFIHETDEYGRSYEWAHALSVDELLMGCRPSWNGNQTKAQRIAEDKALYAQRIAKANLAVAWQMFYMERYFVDELYKGAKKSPKGVPFNEANFEKLRKYEPEVVFKILEESDYGKPNFWQRIQNNKAPEWRMYGTANHEKWLVDYSDPVIFQRARQALTDAFASGLIFPNV